MLVSQIERSGGTLLSRLFDGHPECHAHPRELEIGYPNKKRHWPPIDLARPENWFEMLHETHVGKYRRKGDWSSKRGLRSGFRSSSRSGSSRRSSTVRRGPGTSKRARRPRLLLHLLLQRLARQPQPLHRPEEGRHRLRPAAEHGARRGGAVLRRLSGRDVRLHRTESLRLVPVVPGTPRAVTMTSRARWGSGAARRGRARGARAAARARPRRRLRGARA